MLHLRGRHLLPELQVVCGRPVPVQLVRALHSCPEVPGARVRIPCQQCQSTHQHKGLNAHCLQKPLPRPRHSLSMHWLPSPEKPVLIIGGVNWHLLGWKLGTPVSWAREEGQKGQTPAALREEVSTPAATREGRKSRKAGEYTASAISCSALPAVLSSATESCMNHKAGLSALLQVTQSEES